jgi:glycolate oxidase iron-sulfur subunit
MTATRLGAFASPDAPDLEHLRSCVHCGICLPQCPTYRVLGEEMDSPRGRLYLMRAAAEGRLELSPTFARHMELCLGCRACETACPAGVQFGSLMEATRAQLARQGQTSRPWFFERLLYFLLPHPRRLGVAIAIARAWQGSGLRDLMQESRLRRLAPRLAAMEALLPDDLPDTTPPPEFTPAQGARRGRVGLLTGCVQRHVGPQITRDSVRLLSLAGWDVVVPRWQGCCGALELHGGRIQALRRRARKLAHAFESDSDMDYIVTDAAGCGSTMKEYGEWVFGLAGFAERVRDVSELLVEAELPLGPVPTTATYHDACHLAHGQRIRAEPRALLARIPRLQIVPLPDSDLCCGSAGVYNLLEPAMADRLLAMKVDRIAHTGARIVVSGNPGCLLQLAKGCSDRGLNIEVLHPVELLARSVGAGGDRTR